MFFWDTGEVGEWSYPARHSFPFKAVSPLLKQPDGTTTVLKPRSIEAELTSTKHRFFLHTLLIVRAIAGEPRWKYLLVLGSSTVISPMSDPCRLCEQDPGLHKTLQDVTESLKGARGCCAQTDPAVCSCTGVSSGL